MGYDDVEILNDQPPVPPLRQKAVSIEPDIDKPLPAAPRNNILTKLTEKKNELMTAREKELEKKKKGRRRRRRKRRRRRRKRRKPSWRSRRSSRLCSKDCSNVLSPGQPRMARLRLRLRVTRRWLMPAPACLH